MKVLIAAEAQGKPSDKPLVGPGGFFMARGLLRRRREEWVENGRVEVAVRGNYPRDTFDYAHLGHELDEAYATHQVIVALGDRTFRRLTGLELPVDKVRGYVFGVDGKWIIPTYHPTELLKGHQYLLPVLLWDIEKALWAQAEGYSHETIRCVVDPPLDGWRKVVADICQYLDTPNAVLAFDIETPFKRGKQEGDLVDEADPTQTILDISFSIAGDWGVTVPFTMPYLIGIKEIFQKHADSRAVAVAWNLGYDRPRLRKHLGNILPRHLTEDTMNAHHVLFNNLDRGLGFATSLLPYDQRRLPAWKHLGQQDPYYRVADSVALWRNHQDIQKLLVASGQIGVYEQMVLKLDPILERVENVGLLVDQEMRQRVSLSLGEKQQRLEAEMSSAIPPSLLNRKVWKTRKAAEKGLALMQAAGEIGPDAILEPLLKPEKVKVCGSCGQWPITKSHVSRKYLKA